MSDIENSIQAWRRELLASEGIRAEHADELEDHLREEIAHMKSAALSEREMFLVAVERLGRPDALAVELQRADSRAVWRKRWIWMLLGYLALTFGSRAIGSAQLLCQWLFRSRSQTVVFGASCATFVLGVVLVIFLARRLSRVTSRSVESTSSSILDGPRGIVALTLAAFVMQWFTMFGWWYLYARLPWVPADTRVSLFTTSWWTFSVLAAFVPVVALCVLLWRKSQRESAEEREPTGSRGIWTERWIWMLCGYLSLTIAVRVISSAQGLAQWISRTQSQSVVLGATLATYSLGALVVILVARRLARPGTTDDVFPSWRSLATPRGIVALALVGLVVEWLVAYGSWLGAMQLEWKPGDTRLEISIPAVWALMSAIAVFPVAVLCVLLWLDRKREPVRHRAERAEA